MVTGTQYRTAPGHAHPLGALAEEGGVNFSVYAPRASAVTLLLFDEHAATQPIAAIELDPEANRTFQFWHVFVEGAAPGLHYAYRVDGPRDLAGSGDRHNAAKVLVDPYGRGITAALWDRARACDSSDNLECSMRSAVVDVDSYDWEGDQPLKRPLHQAVIYELHVGGFTRSASSGTASPGTFSGVVEKIPYLRDLGVTAVELLPVFAFDESGIGGFTQDGTLRRDYWGYNPVGFFSPHAGYCSTPEEGGHITEFRDMAKALHRAGIEVILDVVFNHTSEGNNQGPVISLKGFSNETYYCLSPQDKQYYLDYSGCGNTVGCNHPVTEKMILECLEFWVSEMHVDGFRFDEASILSRSLDGTPLECPPVLWGIELSERLADIKIIAEAWDAGGLYQVSNFPGGPRWSVWNGRYRDDVRRFVRGDGGLVGAVATRIAGSADLFQPVGQLPVNSINFVTAHDGFTLNDLVSFNVKHNEANGEGNRDGNDDNESWNCGAEGPASDPAVEALRERQIKNFATILLISQGVPMFVAGDEVRRSQQGNNNAYCQDNEIGWFNWDTARANQPMFRFFKEMIAFRERHPAVRRPCYFSGKKNERGLSDVAWHGCELDRPGWSDPESSVLAFTLGGFDGDNDLHVMLNMSSQDLEFEIPPVPDRDWWRAVDTSLPAPEDIAKPGDEIQVKPADNYRVNYHSAVILLSR
jgi:isoamylase